MKTIMVDVDGCLADFMLSWRTLANRLFGVEIYKTGSPQYTNWSQADLTPRQQDEMWVRVKADPCFWYDAPSLLTDKEAELLVENQHKHHFYFVTARVGETAKPQTEAWLQKHFDITNPTVVISKWKGEVASAIEAHAAIDDKAENAWDIAQHTRGKTRSYLLDKPFNQSSESPAVVRVYTMLEFFNKM